MWRRSNTACQTEGCGSIWVGFGGEETKSGHGLLVTNQSAPQPTGPLLYHFEGMQNESSIELSYEELKIVMQSMGFDILEERDAESTYAGNPKSMLSYNYRCKMFVARKIPAQ